MERTYTDKELESLDNPPFAYQGKVYDQYAASQKQREIEREIRKHKRRQTAFKAQGNTAEASVAGARVRALNREYKAFSEAADLPMQQERLKVLYSAPASKSVENAVIRDTIEKTDSGGSFVEFVAHIDRKKYAGISDKIRDSAVVLTENQKQHIIGRRGQAFYETYSPYFKEIVEDPDYIFKDKAHENTAIASKTLSFDGKNVNLVIRLAVEEDDNNLENSIITAIAENRKRYEQRIRNNVPLYKKE